MPTIRFLDLNTKGTKDTKDTKKNNPGFVTFLSVVLHAKTCVTLLGGSDTCSVAVVLKALSCLTTDH